MHIISLKCRIETRIRVNTRYIGRQVIVDSVMPVRGCDVHGTEASLNILNIKIRFRVKSFVTGPRNRIASSEQLGLNSSRINSTIQRMKSCSFKTKIAYDRGVFNSTRGNLLKQSFGLYLVSSIKRYFYYQKTTENDHTNTSKKDCRRLPSTTSPPNFQHHS